MRPHEGREASPVSHHSSSLNFTLYLLYSALSSRLDVVWFVRARPRGDGGDRSPAGPLRHREEFAESAYA